MLFTRRSFSTAAAAARPSPMFSKSLLFAGTFLAGSGGSYLFSDQIRRSSTYLAVSDHVLVPLMRKFMDAEDAHNWTITAAKWNLTPMEIPRVLEAHEITNNIYKKRNLMKKQRAAGGGNSVDLPSSTSKRLRTTVWGRDFPNPVGMAAGFDKHAEVMGPLLDMGFGFVEVGGVTPSPQNGNPRPRSFRLDEDRAIINRYGLNSHGAKVVGERLAAFRSQGPHRTSGAVGVNLAKNTETIKTAKEDYISGLQTLGPHVDFIVMNISCPNVAWTSKLKDSEISDLVVAVREARDKYCEGTPVLLKIGPDYDEAKITSIVTVAKDTKVDGLIVSNTSTSRPDTLISPHRIEKGGLSGAPIKERALATLQKVYALTNGSLPIIGVGGIASGADAYARIRAGASLVEVYTAMTFGGPSLIQEIKHDLDACLIRDGFSSLAEAVGADYR